MSRKAIFLDRDGVLNDVVPDPETGNPESPYRPEDVALMPDAAEAILKLRTAGWALVVTSNQPAAVKGKAGIESLRAVHLAIRDALPPLDGWRYCLHHQDFDGPCPCRKPAPGMLISAAFELDLDLAASWIVGDSSADVGAGEAAGCRTALVEHPGTAHRRSADLSPTLRAGSLGEVVDLLRHQSAL